MSGWYPPGVSGGEYEIAGADAEGEADVMCQECGVLLGWETYQGRRRLWCPDCDYLGEWEADSAAFDAVEDDFDAAYDEAKGN